jgi:hypothetical protein
MNVYEQTKAARQKEAARQAALDSELSQRPAFDRKELCTEACEILAAANRKLEFIRNQKAQTSGR